MRASEIRRVAAGASLALMATAALAQATPSREQEQIRRLRQQVQQLQAEQAGVQQQAQRAAAEKSALAAQLEQARAGAVKARAGQGAQVRRLRELEQALAAARAERDASDGELQDMKRRQAELAERLAGVEGESRRQREALATSQDGLSRLRIEHRNLGEQFGRCTAANAALARVGGELVDRLGRFGDADLLAAREPFLQFKRVELENLAQDYRAKVDEQVLPAPRPAN